MFVIIGIVIVFGAVIGGFLMEKGHMLVLLQPAELLIIAGAALGTMLVANPLHILKKILAGLLGVLKGSRFSQATLPEFFEDDVRVAQQGTTTKDWWRWSRTSRSRRRARSSTSIRSSRRTIMRATLSATRCGWR